MKWLFEHIKYQYLNAETHLITLFSHTPYKEMNLEEYI